MRAQDYDRLEIIVSDNASTDQTRDVVEALDDPRIRYINPGRRLSMSDHWEFALGHVSDGFVSFLGDDDGVMPKSITSVASLLQAHHTEAVIWPLSAYYWPGYGDPSLANHVSVRAHRGVAVRTVHSREALGAVANFEKPHYALPSPYWGLVHRRAIDRARSRNGSFFLSITPDLYAGVAVAAVTESYLHVDRIVTLSGSSHHSNGASQISGRTTSTSSSPQSTFLTENTHPFHRDVDYCGSVPVLVAEVLLQARDGVDPTIPTPSLRALAHAALSHDELLFNPGSASAIYESLRKTGALHNQRPVVDGMIRRAERSLQRRRVTSGILNVLAGNPIHRCPPHVMNIFDATLFVDQLLTRGDGLLATAGVDARGRVTKIRTAAKVAQARFR